MTTILGALNGAYDFIADAPPFGWARKSVGLVVSLNADGSVHDIIDVRTPVQRGKKTALVGRPIIVPAPWRGTNDLTPSLLWDNTAYALGVSDTKKTNGKEKEAKAKVEVKDAARHREWLRVHRELLADATDLGLVALRGFLDIWQPAMFAGYGIEIDGANVVFTLEQERKNGIYLHDRAAAKALVDANVASRLSILTDGIDAVTGLPDKIARLHPSIRGVSGAQGSGAALVSFNEPAFCSHGREQGDNAQIGVQTTFRYTTALNQFLSEDRHRLRLAEMTVVIWAEADNAAVREEAEDVFAAMFVGVDENTQTEKVRVILEQIRRGGALASFAPELAKGVRFHVLGLTANSGRLVARNHYTDTFGALTEHYQRYLAETALEKDARLSLFTLFSALTQAGDASRVPRPLTADLLHSILTGENYPLPLFHMALERYRIGPRDHDVKRKPGEKPMHHDPRRVAIIKATLIRNHNMEVPMALDTTNSNPAYLRGRLLATLDYTQKQAIPGVSNSVGSQFMAAALTRPESILPTLVMNAEAHFGAIGRKHPGREVFLRRLVQEIIDKMNGDAFPAIASAAEQGLSIVAYHQQTAAFYRRKDSAEESADAEADSVEGDGDDADFEVKIPVAAE